MQLVIGGYELGQNLITALKLYSVFKLFVVQPKHQCISCCHAKHQVIPSCSNVNVMNKIKKIPLPPLDMYIAVVFATLQQNTSVDYINTLPFFQDSPSFDAENCVQQHHHN